ncbi:hypothetical protein Tco_0875435 [Tanacetum coccineum]|uniref:Uncharacterized protein n=1 Tax=Tanacetum coccineum TaxID=301880 RepID=A0ABQ5BR66_9ASTR
MDLETAQTNAIAKLPILKQGEYEMWRLRIEQYFQVQDYALWDVIENGNSFKPTTRTTSNADGTSTSMIPGPITTEEKAQKKNDVKARSMLLMALPNEHQLIFNQYKDAKTLFDAVQIRFGGNDATRKNQKTLLKQMYENFNAPSTKSLDSIFNRLQKIVSQLAILGENISQEVLNLNFLRSLPSEWNTHVVVWRNKSDLDTMKIDDLYNNFKIIEQEVIKTITSSLNSNSQNMAFVSSPSSTNEVNTANVEVSTANSPVSVVDSPDSTANLSDATVYAFLANQPNGFQHVHEDLEQIHEDDLEEMDLKWQLALLNMRARRYFQRTGKKITINGSDTAGYDKSKIIGTGIETAQEGRTVNVEETSSKAIVAIDRAGFDWSFMADEEVPTNMALMAFSYAEFNKSEFNLTTYKRGLASVEEQLVFYKKNEVMFCDQIIVLKRDTSFKDSKINALKRSQISDNSRKGVGFVSYNVVPPPPTDLFAPPTIDLSNSGLEEFQQPEFEGYGPKASKSVCKDTSNEVKKTPDAPLGEKLVSEKEKQIAHCNYHQREGMVNGNNYTRVNYNYSAKKAHLNSHRNITPIVVLMKTGLKTLNTARPVNTAHPKTIVYRARPMSCFSKLDQSTVKRHYQSRTTLTNKNFNQKINTAKEKVYTAKPKAVNTAKPKALNTARPTSAVVNAVRANQVNVVKASTCWVWRPTKLNSASITFKRQNYIDARGRSKSATCPISQTSMNLMEDMLPLEEEPKEEELLAKHIEYLDTKIPQSGGPLVKVGDEDVHKELGDRIEMAAITDSSLEAEQDSDAQTSTAEPDMDVTLAEALVDLLKSGKKKSPKPKARGISFQDPKEVARREVISPPVSKISAKDKFYAEEQAEFERLQKERVAQEEASRAAIYEEMDNIQAMIEADK